MLIHYSVKDKDVWYIQLTKCNGSLRPFVTKDQFSVKHQCCGKYVEKQMVLMDIYGNSLHWTILVFVQWSIFPSDHLMARTKSLNGKIGNTAHPSVKTQKKIER